jgi:hypothetical protein
MAGKRSSGLDFSDRSTDMVTQHPDIPAPANGPSHLARNKTERRRLQGLQRSNTTGSGGSAPPSVPTGPMARFKVWMINEGGRVIFYGVWLFVHVLVLILGALHYDLKDNLTTARKTFGQTFSEHPVAMAPHAWRTPADAPAPQ